jgi:two-component system response regulator HydG
MSIKVLALSEDPTLTTTLEALPKKKFKVVLSDLKKFSENLSQIKAELVIIDCDYKKITPLELFSETKKICPNSKILMTITKMDIALAVKATKLGVENVLAKPINLAIFQDSLDKMFKEKISPLLLDLSAVEDSEWLHGISEKNRQLMFDISQGILSDKDICVTGERGIDKEVVAQVIHMSGSKKIKRMLIFDLSTFSKESIESHFWTIFQDVLSQRGKEELPAKEKVGYVYLKNFDLTPPSFRSSLVEFIKTWRNKAKFDRKIKMILGVEGEIKGLQLFKIHVPPLRERKEDLPVISSLYFEKFKRKYQKEIKAVVPEFLSFLSFYSFPGNYAELRELIKQAVIGCDSDVVDMGCLSLSMNMFISLEWDRQRNQPVSLLKEIKRTFEKETYDYILKLNRQDESAASRFLDIPKSAFSQRKRELGL